jgi:hypothetical protein
MEAQVAALANRPVAVFKRSPQYAGSGVNTVVLTYIAGEPIFTGCNSPGETEDNLFRVVASIDDSQLQIQPGGDIVEVTACNPPLGSGFVDQDVTLTLSEIVPPGHWFKILYGVKSTVGTLNQDALVVPSLLRAPIVEYTLENLLTDLHESSGNPGWKDSWVSSIGDITRRGLDGVYRLKTGTSSGTVDTPGNGAIIQRDGVAPEVVAPEANYLPIPTGDTLYPDPYLAQWKSTLGGSETTDFDISKSGATGFVAVTAGKQSHSANDAVKPGRQYAGFLCVREKSVGDIAPYGQKVRIPAGAAATTVAGTRNVTLTAPNYFAVATETPIRLGFDFLEVTFASGKKQIFIIFALPADDTATLLTLGSTATSGSSNFPANEAVTVRWVQFIASMGGPEYVAPGGTPLGNFVVSSPPFLDVDEESGGPYAFAPVFAAGTAVEDYAGSNDRNIIALQWGGFSPFGDFVRGGYMRGDGGIVCTRGHVSGNFRKNSDTRVISSPQAYTWDVRLVSALNVQFTNDSVLTLNLHGSYTPVEGDEITLIVRQNGTGGGSIVWPSNFLFSGSDDDVTGATGDQIKFTGIFAESEGSPSSRFFMTRTDY